MYKPDWRIAQTESLEELESLVNVVQEKGYVIEDINTTSLTVVYYKYNDLDLKKDDPELLLEQQNEGDINPHIEDRDYGQQSI